MDNGYKVITSCNISDYKEFVVSESKNGDIVLAKRFVVSDGGYERYMYEKGSIVLGRSEFDKFIEGINKYFLYE